MGGAVLEECAEENCVITLGARIGADYIVRGTISKFQTKLTLKVEMYETDNGMLVATSEPVRTENIGELLETGAAACAEMYREFAGEKGAQKPKQKESQRKAVNAQSTKSYKESQRKAVNAQPTERYTANVSPSGEVTGLKFFMDDHKFVTFVGVDDDGKSVYRMKNKLFINRDKGYTAYGDSVRLYRDFSTGRRWATFFLNCPLAIYPNTGLGSFILMKDWVGGSIGLGATAIGATFITIADSKHGNEALGVTGVVLIVGSGVFNYYRSITYHRPMPKSSKTAAGNFKPYDGLKFAILPTESGDFKVFARYDYGF